MPLPEQEVQIVVAERTASLANEVEPHWTAEAMASARSIEPEVDEEEILTLMDPRAWVQDGNPTVMESVPPDGAVIGDDEDIADARDRFMATRVPTGSLDDFPYSAIGKLFMTFDGEDFVGSAWVVAVSAVFTRIAYSTPNAVAGRTTFSSFHSSMRAPHQSATGRQGR